MSSQATAQYYRLLNEAVNAQLGGWNTAEMVINSVNFAEIERFVRSDLWEDAALYLTGKAIGLERAGADLLICVSNTMHRVADAFTESLSIPFIHIADPTGREIVDAGIQTVGLLGTKPIMQADYMKRRYRERFGIEIMVPDENQQNTLDRIIFDELVHGVLTDESKQAYLSIMDDLRSKGAHGIILGCTEIFLLVSQDDMPGFPLFNTTALHVREAVRIALQ